MAERGGLAVRLAAAHAGGLVAGMLLDVAVGDPRRYHPVAGFGRAAAALERRCYRPDLRSGVRFAAIAVGLPVAGAVAATVATRRHPWLRAGLTALATWSVLGGTSLRREAHAMADALERGDLPAARSRLPHLCGRDPSTLDEAELARATVESVAENASDAVVAPLAWGAIAGLPGLVGYRAVNTLDAMVGHRSLKYRRFGTPAARLDDLANLAPSRATAALTAVVAGGAGGSGREALRVWLRDGGRHPSPNAGQCEAAMAGALGVRLGGRNVYEGRVEIRPTLGDGGPVGARDIRRAARISGAVGGVALALAAGHAAAAPWRRAVVRRAVRRLASGGGAMSGCLGFPLNGGSLAALGERARAMSACLGRSSALPIDGGSAAARGASLGGPGRGMSRRACGGGLRAEGRRAT